MTQRIDAPAPFRTPLIPLYENDVGEDIGGLILDMSHMEDLDVEHPIRVVYLSLYEDTIDAETTHLASEEAIAEIRRTANVEANLREIVSHPIIAVKALPKAIQVRKLEQQSYAAVIAFNYTRIKMALVAILSREKKDGRSLEEAEQEVLRYLEENADELKARHNLSEGFIPVPFIGSPLHEDLEEFIKIMVVYAQQYELRAKRNN